MQILITAVAPLFFMVLAGSLVRWGKIADKNWSSVLNKFGLYLGLIPLIVYNLSHLDRTQFESWTLLGLNLLVLVGSVLITWMTTSLLKVKQEIANCYILGCFMGNVAYIGFPFISLLRPGSEGMIGLHVALYLVILFTLGVYILEQEKTHRHRFKTIGRHMITNPLLISVFVGLVLFWFNLQLPKALDESLRILGATSTPVVLTALGMFLVQKIKIDRDLTHAIALTGIKLIVLPASMLVIAYWLQIPRDFEVSVLQAGMPVALAVFAFAEVYPFRKRIVGNAIILSTILSAITLPLWARILS